LFTTRRRRRQEGESDAAYSPENGIQYNGKGKEDYNRPKVTTLDKLEGWLGLSTAGESSTSNVGAPARDGGSGFKTPSYKPQKPSTSRETRLVLVHTVVPTDSLDSLALRFKTDVRALRKANGLWPGDSVLVRKELYIPVDEETAEHYNGTVHASEGLGGKLMLLNSQVGTSSKEGMFSHRPMSSASASSASQSHSGRLPMPSEALSYFPPPGTLLIGKGKARQEEAFGFGEGMKPGEDVDHGESGVDDLLQLAEKARARGSLYASEDVADVHSSLLPVPPTELEAVSPSSSTIPLEEPWKPNKWTFGQKKSSRHLGTPYPSGSTTPLPEIRGSAMMVSSTYQGWNDIPEPPLHRTAKGQVAHAYKGASNSRLYPRPGGLLDLTGSGTIIDDLAAGLPANPGPASNWARPIAESLPVPGSSSLDGNSNRRGRTVQATNPGWAQLLSDTVRGRIGLDEAIERGFDDFRLLAGGSGGVQQGLNGSTRRAMLQNAAISHSQRPSAELARVTLGDGHSSHSSQTSSASNGVDVGRSNGGRKSVHELEDLTVAEELNRQSHSSTWALAGSNGSEGNNNNTKGRKTIRSVDWLS
jgi:LysM repeat protein